MARTEPETIEAEIAQLRGLDLAGLRTRWRSVFRQKPPAHLSRHLLFRLIAYRLQAERFGDLDRETLRFLDRIADGSSTESKTQAIRDQRVRASLRPGTALVREWKGKHQHVVVLAQGFAWGGKTYRSLSEVAFAITGTRWSGPRFFGLRERGRGAT